MPDRAELRVVAMQDQRGHGDAVEGVADIAFPDFLDECAGHAGRCGTVAGVIPPGAKRVVDSHRGSDDAEHVEALLDGVGLDPDRREWIGAALIAADRITGPAQSARPAVEDHQVVHPLGVIGGEDESGQRSEPRRENRGPLRSNRVHDRDRVLRPRLRPHHVHRGDPRGQADPALVEPNDPAERGQPAMKAVHRRLLVYAVDRESMAPATRAGRSGRRRRPDRRCLPRRNWHTGSAEPQKTGPRIQANAGPRQINPAKLLAHI